MVNRAHLLCTEINTLSSNVSAIPDGGAVIDGFLDEFWRGPVVLGNLLLVVKRHDLESGRLLGTKLLFADHNGDVLARRRHRLDREELVEVCSGRSQGKTEERAERQIKK